MAYACEVGDPRLTVFVRSKYVSNCAVWYSAHGISRKHPYYLNGRFLYLYLSQATILYGFHLRNILLDRFAFRWSMASSSSSVQEWPFQFPDLVNTSLTLTLFACICTFSSASAFAVARALLPLLFNLPFLPYILKPLTAHFLRGPWTIFLPFLHFSLLIRTFLLSIATLSSLEFANVLFDSFVTRVSSLVIVSVTRNLTLSQKPIIVARGTTDPSLTLISGITSSDMCFKFFAYSELNQLATDESPASSARRTAFFGDTKYTPNMWSQLVREGLLLLGRDYQAFLRRGKAPSQIPPAPPPNVASAPMRPFGTPTPVIKKSIFKVAPRSPIHAVADSLAADGPFSQATEAGAGSVHIPELFRSVESLIRPTVTTPENAVLAPKSVGLMGQWRAQGSGILQKATVGYIPEWVRDALETSMAWWRRDRINKMAEACLPTREIDIAVIQGVFSPLPLY